jgi:hypothetical protein
MNNLDNLSKQIEWIEGYPNYIACPEEWYPTLNKCWNKLVEINPNIQILQIKSKFNGLRFYIRHTNIVTIDDAMDNIVREAEHEIYMYEKARNPEKFDEHKFDVYSPQEDGSGPK